MKFKQKLSAIVGAAILAVGGGILLWSQMIEAGEVVTREEERGGATSAISPTRLSTPPSIEVDSRQQEQPTVVAGSAASNDLVLLLAGVTGSFSTIQCDEDSSSQSISFTSSIAARPAVNARTLPSAAPLVHEGRSFNPVDIATGAAFGGSLVNVYVPEEVAAVWVVDSSSEQPILAGAISVRANPPLALTTSDSALNQPLCEANWTSASNPNAPPVPLLFHVGEEPQKAVWIGAKGYEWKAIQISQAVNASIVRLEPAATLAIHVRCHRPAPGLLLKLSTEGGRTIFSMPLDDLLWSNDDRIQLNGLSPGKVDVSLVTPSIPAEMVRSENVELAPGGSHRVDFDVAADVDRQRLGTILELRLPDALELIESQVGSILTYTLEPDLEALLNGAQSIVSRPLARLP